MTFPHFGESFVARGQAPLQPLLWPCVRHHALALAYRKQALPRCSVHSLHEAKCPAIGRSHPQHSLREWSGCMRASASAIVVVSFDVCGTMPLHFIAGRQRTILILCCERNCSLTFLCRGHFVLALHATADVWVLFQDKYKDAFPCFFIFPLTLGDKWLSPITSQEVGRIFSHAFPNEACLALCSESAFR